VADFEGFGRGMAAKHQLDEGKFAVMVPRKMILNVETAYAEEKLGTLFLLLLIIIYFVVSF
jgi:hypothetical protein